MHHLFSRRRWMKIAPLSLPFARSVTAAPAADAVLPDTFPTQPAALVREMVGASHANIKRVRELVEARPSLARSAWDWGFGDWETALGAASHMGNREIAEYLLSKGARPTIFSAAMFGQLDVVKAFVSAMPGIQQTMGPHSISLLSHAEAGGVAAKPVRDYLASLGDAGDAPAVQIADDELKSLVGTYSYGPGSTERIDITNKGGQLQFTRIGTTPRNLRHIGGRVFHPVGAAAVRIRFVSTANIMTFTVHDPDVVLTARRAGA